MITSTASRTGAADDDDVWIPQVTQAAMAIITRDTAILRRLREIAAIKASGARVFALAGSGTLGRWELLEMVVAQWRTLEKHVAKAGPFVYSVNRTTVSRLDI